MVDLSIVVTLAISAGLDVATQVEHGGAIAVQYCPMNCKSLTECDYCQIFALVTLGQNSENRPILFGLTGCREAAFRGNVIRVILMKCL